MMNSFRYDRIEKIEIAMEMLEEEMRDLVEEKDKLLELCKVSNKLANL